jgi:hypothetical protein
MRVTRLRATSDVTGGGMDLLQLAWDRKVLTHELWSTYGVWDRSKR